MHSCGNIIGIIPDLIELGLDALHPIQPNAIDQEKVVQQFAGDITFWGGGADTRSIINRKSPEEVKKHVLELLEIFAPGGGYVWSAVHNILPDVPPENIVAMFEAIRQYNNQN